MNFSRVVSFDKTSSTESRVLAPADFSELIEPCSTPVIARGAGLSYGNASSANGGTSMSMLRFNRILSFDDEKGLLMVEAGISVGDIVSFLADKKWMMPVVPGYPAITVGGCLAFNVHGKAQHRTGNIINWVEEFILFHPSRDQMVCSRVQNEDVFNLTIGGMGLTGIILSVTLRLKKREGDSLEIKMVRAENLRDTVNIMNKLCETSDYVYSWNNFNLKNDSFGRGIVYAEKYFSENIRAKTAKYENRLSNSYKLPLLFNKFSVRLFCALYYQMEMLKSSPRIIDLQRATFPIYGQEIYYALYGKKGFREYQVLFPANNWQRAAEEMKELIAKFDISISLASLKIFRGEKHYLSFSGEGICIAIHVANNAASDNFLRALDNVTVKYHGIINLSKDSRAAHETVKEIFPDYNLFKGALNKFDSEKFFVSDLRNRIDV